MNTTYLNEWLGRTEERSDQISGTPIAALAALLDKTNLHPQHGDPIPPLGHWLSFLPIHPQSKIGRDGHPERGGFLPAVDLPRRMWAGGRLKFHHPLRIGDAVTRMSSIVDISSKMGKTGQLVFVLLRHEICNADGVAITEEQEIVYRDSPRPGDAGPAPIAADTNYQWIREIYPDPVLLFKFSALTFNSHRIHYDHPYATNVEGYPGLVVHGPFIATLLIDLVRRQLPDAEIENFSFRAIRPLFDIAPFHVCGRLEQDKKTLSLWAKDATGSLAMSAVATLGAPLRLN